MKYLGIDYGTKRIGVAVSDNTGTLAFPLTTVAAGPNACTEIVELAKKNAVQQIILGESRNFKDEANPLMEDIEQFKKDVEKLSGLPVEYQAEFLTSAAAARQYASEEKTRKEPLSQKKLDAAAAALILQSFLDRMKDNA